jgi:hypothetical protein
MLHFNVIFKRKKPQKNNFGVTHKCHIVAI